MELLMVWWNAPATRQILGVIAGVVAALTLTRFLGRWLSTRVQDTDARYRVRKVVTAIGYLIAVLVILNVYSVKLQGLTVLLGVAGAGIAFALQEVIASAAGWVALTFSRFYSPGDRIQLGGIKGDVIDVGVLRTTLMEIGEWVKGDLYTGRIVRIANSFVFKEPVFNYSGDFPFVWDEIVLPIKYGSDRARALALIEGVADETLTEYATSAEAAWSRMVREYRIENARVKPMVTLIANDNWLEYTLRYVVDYQRRRATKHMLFNRILDEIDKTAGAVATASATFQFVEWPTLDVRLLGGRDGGAEAARGRADDSRLR